MGTKIKYCSLEFELLGASVFLLITDRVIIVILPFKWFSFVFLCSLDMLSIFPTYLICQKEQSLNSGSIVNLVFWFGLYITHLSNMNNITFHFNFGKLEVLNKNTNSSLPSLIWLCYVHLSVVYQFACVLYVSDNNLAQKLFSLQS